jgi:hypothetical protein
VSLLIIMVLSCCRPRVVLTRRLFPDLKLRPGNVHSAEGWEELLLPKIERQQQLGKEVAFRSDAALCPA